MRSPSVFTCVMLLLAPLAAVANDFESELTQWKQERVTRLTAPDGWLTLIGLHWLDTGTHTIGSAADNSIRFAGGPAHLGKVEVTPRRIVFFPTHEAEATTDGGLPIRATKTGSIRLDYHDDPPTVVRSGSLSFFVIQRGERLALRVRDNEAARRRDFAGIDYFPADPSWRIEADWVQFETPREIPITNLLGQTSPGKVPGKAVFTRDGQTIELIPFAESAGETLFFVISDGTSGEETYEAARFLYAAPPKDGKVILDFNRAQNPPCAFTPFATCPLPPRENQLKIRVPAGEKNYRGEH
jgi:uncharacterized protein